VPRLLGGDFGAYLTPEHTRDIVSYVRQYRASDEPFDIVISGHTASASDSARVRDVEGAGATWWCEDISPWPFGWNWEGPWPVDAMRDRIRGGPPRL